MNPAHRLTLRPFRLSALAVLLCLFSADAGAAQQFLGNMRQRCTGPVTLAMPGGDLKVNQFEARSSQTADPTVRWQCQGQQPAEVQCPANTNKVLIDRSQGGSVFSIICLHQ